MIYEYICKGCGNREDRARPVSKMYEKVVCHLCGNKAEKIFSVPSNIIVKQLPRDFGKTMDAEKEISITENLDTKYHRTGARRKWC